MEIKLQHGNTELRPTTEADVEKVILIENDGDNAPYIRHWTPEEHLAAIHDNNIAHFIIRDVASGEIVGYTILIGVESYDRCLEFRRIAVAVKGKGYGRNGVKLIKKFAFERLQFHRLWLDVLEYNTRAYNLYQSEGFVREGVHREAKRQGDEFHSLVVMSMLRQEYTACIEQQESQ